MEIKKSDTLLVMLEKVYGHSRARYKKAVVKTNSHISNINALEIGDIIHFPPVAANLPVDAPKYFWVKVGAKKNLNAAVEFSRRWQMDTQRIKIIPYFSKGNGLQFDIILRQLFKDKTEASNYIDSFKELVSDKVEIMEFSFGNTIFFADPYRL